MRTFALASTALALLSVAACIGIGVRPPGVLSVASQSGARRVFKNEGCNKNRIEIISTTLKDCAAVAKMVQSEIIFGSTKRIDYLFGVSNKYHRPAVTDTIGEVLDRVIVMAEKPCGILKFSCPGYESSVSDKPAFSSSCNGDPVCRVTYPLVETLNLQFQPKFFEEGISSPREHFCDESRTSRFDALFFHLVHESMRYQNPDLNLLPLEYRKTYLEAIEDTRQDGENPLWDATVYTLLAKAVADNLNVQGLTCLMMLK